MSDKINLGVENVFSKDVLLPFSKRRRTGTGGRSGVEHTDLAILVSDALKSQGERNLRIKNNASSQYTKIDVDADFLVVQNYGLYDVNLTIDSAVNGINGLDTGSLAMIWYSIWVIYSPRNGLIAGLFSASADDPVLPENYTEARRVGWVLNIASPTNLLSFQQKGHKVWWRDYIGFDENPISSTTWTTVNNAPDVNYIPPGIELVECFFNTVNDDVAVQSAWVREDAATGGSKVVGSTKNATRTNVVMEIPVTSARKFQARVSDVDVGLEILLFGWTDPF